VVLTIPRLLRPLFRRRRDLLTELARAAAEATAKLVRCAAATDARPGTVVSIATAGDLLQWHPICTCVPQWDPTLLMSLFRQRLLARLLDRHAISQELAGKLLAWRHPGFSAHVGEERFHPAGLTVAMEAAGEAYKHLAGDPRRGAVTRRGVGRSTPARWTRAKLRRCRLGRSLARRSLGVFDRL
jgi:hypothetical protein